MFCEKIDSPLVPRGVSPTVTALYEGTEKRLIIAIGKGDHLPIFIIAFFGEDDGAFRVKLQLSASGGVTEHLFRGPDSLSSNDFNLVEHIWGVLQFPGKNDVTVFQKPVSQRAVGVGYADRAGLRLSTRMKNIEKAGEHNEKGRPSNS